MTIEVDGSPSRDPGGMPLRSESLGGALTFVFTDIEGSTKLWERQGEAMGEALSEHDRRLQEIVAEHGGRVFKKVGDALCAAFEDPGGAIEAVIAGQCWLLARGSKPGVLPLRVRMAVHTGVAERRDGDFFGQTLNRVARILSTAHGGQILLSAATMEMVRDHLPEGADLESLGAHRLKDLGRPESVYQLLHPALPREFPPLRSLDHPELKHNLPRQLTSFIGRERELAEIRTQVDRARLVTLVGPGGAGKTRLSLQVAADLLEGSGDGVWLVELAEVEDGDRLPYAIAGALGIQSETGSLIQESILTYLAHRRLLLVLDNCEHLIVACARLVATVLRECPGLRVLASSREPIGISGEQIYRVPVLELPSRQVRQTAESISHYEAVRLFIERAMLARPDFSVTNDNAPAVASICQSLDGIPLAIELAAARTRSMTVEDIDRRLDQRFRLLKGGDRSALPRQQTLQSLIDWSHDLLEPSERVMLRRLAVFAGGWTLSDAEAVVSGGEVENWEVLDLLASLVDKSIVIFDERAPGGRYRMLQTIRQYAAQKLETSGELDALRDAHLQQMITTVSGLAPDVVASSTGDAVERLDAEMSNVWAALSWAEERARLAPGIELAAACAGYWHLRDLRQPGLEHMQRLLEQSEASEPALDRKVRAKGLRAATHLCFQLGRFADARGYVLPLLEIAEALDLGGEVCFAHAILGIVAQAEGELEQAQQHLQTSLEIARDRGLEPEERSAAGNLAIILSELGETARARQLTLDALEAHRRAGDRFRAAISLQNLATFAMKDADFQEARRHAQESLEEWEVLGHGAGIINLSISLASIAIQTGNPDEALQRLRVALDLAREWNDAWRSIRVLEGFGHLALEVGQPAIALKLFSASRALAAARGVDLHVEGFAERDAMLERSRAMLQPSPREAAWKEGQRLSLDDAVAVALGIEAPSSPGA